MVYGCADLDEILQFYGMDAEMAHPDGVCLRFSLREGCFSVGYRL